MVRSVRRNRRTVTVVACAVLLIAGLVWGIAGALAESGSPAPATGKVILKVGWTRDADNLNVFLGYSASAFTVWYLNYDCLVGFNPADLSPSNQGGLATEWSTDASGKVWTFKLRDATWQDGQPVTADDVAFTYNYIVDNDMYNWTSYTAGIKHVTAIDPKTVQIECSSPKPSLIRGWVPIIPKHIWEKVKPSDAEGGYTPKLPLVGSGPFQVTEWKKKAYLTMVANKSYWRGAPKIDEIIWQTYTNADTMAQEFIAKSLDACTGLLGAQVKQANNISGLHAEGVQVNAYDELGFNCYDGESLGNPVLKDWKFRQALQWAVDKQKIADIAYSGFAKPADTVVVSNYFHNPDWHWTPPADQAYTFDIAKANAALDAAGYTDTNNDGIRDYKGKAISLRLWARAEGQESQLTGKLLTDWFKQCKLKIQFDVLEEGTLTDKLYNTVGGKFVPDYDMFLWGWYNDIDPSIGLDYFTTAQINGWSDCAWSNKEYDALQKQGQQEIDVTKRKAIIDRQQQIIYEQSPYIVTVYSNDIEGWNTSKWTDWVRTPANVGNVVMPPTGLSDNYLSVRLNTGGSNSTSGSSRTALWIVIGVAAVVVIAVLVVVFTRRKPQTMEE